MTLRQTLGDDGKRLHEALEALLDKENALVLLFDGDRTVSYMEGFGLSPSQHELIALDIERVVRQSGATTVSKRTAEQDDPLTGLKQAA